MKPLLLFLLACVMLHLPSISQAQEDGTRFLRACGATVKQQDGANVSAQEMLESLWCNGYVQGFTDSIPIMQAVIGSPQAVCLPQQGVEVEQGVRIFVKYLRDNPQTLHQTGRMSLYIALGKAFPCK